MEKNVIAIIPARGGSKGIPRKNVRELDGKPLIYYAIKNGLEVPSIDRVYLTTDSDEIAYYGKLFGAEIVKRPPEFGRDDTTLDPVIHHCVEVAEEREGKNFDIVLTLQPTSPTLRAKTIEKGLKEFSLKRADTLISVKERRKLSWKSTESGFIPSYDKRVNRQSILPEYDETGGFLITLRKFVNKNSRIGKQVTPFILDDQESVDIDSTLNWAEAEHILQRKRIGINVLGSDKVGLGHVYRTLLLSDALIEHDVKFFIPEDQDLALEKIKGNNYNTEIYSSSDELLLKLKEFKPHILINDILDTEKDFIEEVKEMGIYIVNFEDLGEGSRYAHTVINGLYEKEDVPENHFFGHRYYCIRRDLQFLPPKNQPPKRVENILVSFGGTDQNDLTSRVLKLLSESEYNGKITVVLGRGYKKRKEIVDEFPQYDFLYNIKNMGEVISSADMGITSAGRTVYEFVSLRIPLIVLAQNKRETTHEFARRENGIIYAGMQSEVSDKILSSKIKSLVENFQLRKNLFSKMKKIDLSNGLYRVKNLILDRFFEFKNED